MLNGSSYRSTTRRSSCTARCPKVNSEKSNWETHRDDCVVGYIINGMAEKVVQLFKKMSVQPDDVLRITLFNACAKHVTAESRKLGEDVLRRLPSNFHQKPQLANAAVDMLMKFGEVKRAEQLFASMKTKTLVSFGAMMQGLFSI